MTEKDRLMLEEIMANTDKEELTKHLNKLRRKFANRSVLVQEFLEIDNEIDLSGVCLDQEIIIPAIIKKTNVTIPETVNGLPIISNTEQFVVI